MANHLVHSAVQADLDANKAVDQIMAVASELDEPVELNDGQKKALALIFSSEGEQAQHAASVALANGPHFILMDGAWSIKLVEVSTGGVAPVPIVSLNILWHDQTGTGHEAFFQMSEAEWQDFCEKVDTIGDLRKEMDPLLQFTNRLNPNDSEDH